MSKILTDSETELNSQFDIEKIKEEYNITSTETKLASKEEVVFTSLYHRNGTEFYTGEIDIFNTKCGNGLLIINDGTKYQGFFKDNELVYGRHIDSDGIIYEGMLI